jgi:bacillithiol system protein YtxJ
MGLKERIHFLTTAADVDLFLAAHPTSAIFKAGTCHKTQETFGHVEALLGPREDLELGVIRVVESRPASNRVAELTGVVHESPQLFLFKDGTSVFDRDNWDITAEALEHALDSHFARV